MDWLGKLPALPPITHALLILAVVAVLGQALGRVQIGRFALGIAGVLFAGLAVGHLHPGIPAEILEFVRDFGLVLFVYTIGLQVGPGFFTSLRREGLPLNLLAAAIVLLGAGGAVGLALFYRIDMAAAVGLFAGATTNTPALGAAQQALAGLAGVTAERAAQPALGYAVAYPFGILGIIFSMVLFRVIFRIQPGREAEEFHRAHQDGEVQLGRMNIEIQNANIAGVAIHDLPAKRELGITISRIRFLGDETAQTARGEMPVHVGDLVLAVGPRRNLEKFRLIVGRESPVDLMQLGGEVTFRRVVVTRAEALGKSLGEIGFNQVHGVTVTRLVRAGLEMPASAALRLQFGDVLQVVGTEAAIARVAAEVGNSSKALDQTNFLAVFLGLAAGLLAGLLPLSIPGVPVPVRLGVAGGPLLAAIFLSRLGRIGPIVWYMPDNANRALREFGIILFLAAVGLKAGEHFLEVLLRGDGLLWIGCAAVITLVPLLLAGTFGRVVLKLNFIPLCGLLAGSMTDPPALAFANAAAGSAAPSLAYAAVYPLTMLLRIVVAQLLVLIFVR